MANKQEIKEILDTHAIALVGILCKRIELIEKISKDKHSSELIQHYPTLFKSLSKELVYEAFRNLRDDLYVSFIPTVVYREK